MFRRVLVPVSGSDLSEKALAHAVAFARQLDLPVTLLRSFNFTERLAMVDAPTLDLIAGGDSKEEAEARAFLDAEAAALRARGVEVETVVLDAPADAAIVEEANRVPETLLVIGTHDRGRLARLFRGGTADAVLQGVQGPILLVHADGPHAP